MFRRSLLAYLESSEGVLFKGNIILYFAFVCFGVRLISLSGASSSCSEKKLRKENCDKFLSESF